MAEKKKNKLGAKAIFARILAVILVTAIGGVASFFGFKTYFSDKLKKDKKAEIAKQLKEESKESEKKIPFSKKKKGSVCCCRNDGFGIGDWHDKSWRQTILVESCGSGAGE